MMWEERLVRWLMMSHDRIGGVPMPLTQDFLGQMLGARRSSVSTATSVLQKAGIITYTRGNVTILDKTEANGNRLRLLRNHSTSEGKLAGGNVLIAVA